MPRKLGLVSIILSGIGILWGGCFAFIGWTMVKARPDQPQVWGFVIGGIALIVLGAALLLIAFGVRRYRRWALWGIYAWSALSLGLLVMVVAALSLAGEDLRPVFAFILPVVALAWPYAVILLVFFVRRRVRLAMTS